MKLELIINRDNHYERVAFLERPLLGPLLFANNASDARDHCANERSTPELSSEPIHSMLTSSAFLSWLRLATYMAIVSVAIVISFHLKHQPSDLGSVPIPCCYTMQRLIFTCLERRLALPFGLIFWVLSLACLISGLANYINTVTNYSRRAALVQSGWKTQIVSCPTSSSSNGLTIENRFLLLSQLPLLQHAFYSCPLVLVSRSG